MFVPTRGTDAPTFTDHTLLLPSVGIGNVGQLALDLILNTHRAKVPTSSASALRKIGHFHSVHASPVAGNDATRMRGDAPGQLTVNNEVYQAPGTPVTILQRRAPHLKGHSHAFVAELVAWAKKAGFSQVLVATGADAGHRTDIQLTGSQVRVLGTDAWTGTPGAAACEALGWKRVELPAPEGPSGLMGFQAGIGRRDVSGAGETKTAAQEFEERLGSLNLAGFTSVLLRETQAAGLAAAVVVLFVHEGDNLADGVRMATGLDDLLHFVVPSTGRGSGAGAGAGAGSAATDGSAARQGQRAGPARKQPRWIPPSSWMHVYGAAFNPTLYL